MYQGYDLGITLQPLFHDDKYTEKGKKDSYQVNWH